jgi:uncharacterized membrane protein (UPF0127 family)
VSRPHFLQALLKRRDGPIPFRLRNTRSGLDVATSLETAFSSSDRKRGLLGRDGLAPGQALIIAPTNLVHTFAMRFPIDIIFVARDGRVIKVSRAVPRRRIAGAFGGFGVVELAADEARRSQTGAGDLLEVLPL